MELINIEKGLKQLIVIKRNGRKVEFEGDKIAIAIKKAFDSVANDNYTEKDANKVYIAVLKELYDKYIIGNDSEETQRKIKIETIQDIIVNKLKSLKYLEVYESFIQYRENRKKIRDAFEERKQYKFLGILDKLKIEDNIAIKEKKGGTTPKSKIEKLGNDILKQYAMTQTIKKKYLESHEIGEIYIHDIECIPTGITGFTELELSEKLDEDFVRDRNIKEKEMDIYTYTNIISNIMLLTSREQYYGEGIPAFDFLLAKAVLKTFKQNFRKLLLEYLEFTEFLQFLPMNGILREIEKIESIGFDLNIFKGYLRESNKVFKIFEKVYVISLEKTKKDTYNAIMLFINNINVLSEERERKLIFSLNLGTDTSKEGRLVTKTLFKVLNNIEINKKDSILEVIFKLSRKINFMENTINHDLFLESLELNLKNIKYSMLDSTFNKEKYIENNYLTEVAYLNGIRIIDNNLDDKRAIVGGRGLLRNS